MPEHIYRVQMMVAFDVSATDEDEAEGIAYDHAVKSTFPYLEDYEILEVEELEDD